MFQNYLKVAWRTLWKSKVYSFINIGGLGLGLSVSMLILLFVLHEFSYDRFHSGADQIYRMQGTFKFGEKTFNTLSMSAGTGPQVVESLPEVEQAVRVYQNLSPVFQSNPQHIFREDYFLMVEPNFLEMFSFEWLEGNETEALAQPQSLVLTPATAKKYFGHTNVIGESLLMDGELPFTITGLIAPPPSNSTLQFGMLASLNSLTLIERNENPEIKETSLTLNNKRVQLGSIVTFLKMGAGQDADLVAEKITELGKSESEEETDSQNTFSLHPLLGIHLKSNFGDFSNLRYIYFFLGIALLILLLALINYISLSTARAVKRAKEVGIRKVNGAHRKNLLVQFYGESALMTGFAFLLGLGILSSIKPTFLQLLDLEIDTSFFYHPSMIATFFGLLFISILLAGSIPAILMSSFSPIKILRGEVSSGKRGHRMRKGLILFQFTTTLALIMISIFVGRQLKYMQSQSSALLGDQIIELSVSKTAQSGFQAYKEAIVNRTDANQLGVASSSIFGRGMSVFFVKSPVNQQDIALYLMNVDKKFLQLFNLDWSRSLQDANRLGDESTMVLNKIAVDQFGLNPDTSTQLNVEVFGKNKEIVGVLESFRFQSLRTPEPALGIMVIDENKKEILDQGNGKFYISFPEGASIADNIQQLKRIHAEFEPGQPFFYSFLDETIAQFYKSEARLSALLSGFTGLAILLSCMGLFGLITYNTERRSKEIGIRKVLGASVQSIVKLLTKDFIILVVIALGIAAPISWYLMSKWLDNFVLQIDLSWWVFILAGGLTLGLAMLTIGFQATKTAVNNPANVLRKE